MTRLPRSDEHPRSGERARPHPFVVSLANHTASLDGALVASGRMIEVGKVLASD